MNRSLSKFILLVPPVLLFAASFLFPFVYWPEMLNWPFIMSQGWLPYRDFSIIHTPILPAVLMVSYRLIGFTPFTLHFLGSLLLLTSNIATVYLVNKLIRNWKLAVVAGFVHGFLSLTFEGNTVWFESLLAPLLIGAFWLQHSYLIKPDLKKIFWSGMLMGLIFLTKQTALFLLPEFFVFLGYLLVMKNFKNKKVIKVLFAFSVPIVVSGLVFALLLVSLSIFPDFLNWAVRFVFLWTSLNNSDLPSAVVLPTLRQGLMLLSFFAISLALAIRSGRFLGLFLFIWTWLASLMVVPRFEYFHLLPMLPFFVALLFISAKDRRILAAALTTVLVISLPVFRNTYLIGQRFLTPEIIQVAAWLKENKSDRTIFSLNGPDLVYFLTGKTPAVRPWVDQLPWETAFAGDKFTTAFEKAEPEIIVFRPYLSKPVNGLGAYQPKEIVKYVSKNYHLVRTFSDGVQILERND